MVLLVSVAVLPGVATVIFGYVGAREEAVQRAREEIKAVAWLATANQEQVIEGVRQILATVAAGPSVRRDDLRDLCYEFLRNVAQATPGYGTIGVVNLGGDIQCHGDPTRQVYNVAERSYFRQAVRSRQFSVGEYQVNGVSSEAMLGFAMPVYDYSDRLVGVAFTSIDLAPASAKLESLLASGLIRVHLVAGSGVVLAASHAREKVVGSTLPDLALMDAIRRGSGGGLETRDTRGQDWLHELVPVGSVSGEPLYAIASAPRVDIVTPTYDRLKLQLLMLALATMLGIVAALKLAEDQFVRPINALLHRMRNAAKSIPLARPTKAAPSREFSALDEEFSSMLGELWKTQAQLLKAQQITRVGFFQLDMNTREYSASETIYELLGLDPSMGAVPQEQYQAMIHPDDRELVHKHRTMLFEGGTPLRLQYRIIRPDGTTRWVDGFGFVERDDQGLPTIYAGALQDITEQQRLRRLYLVQSRLNEAILLASSIEELLKQACQIAVDAGEMRMACSAEAGPTGLLVMGTASAGHDDGYTGQVCKAAVDVATFDSPAPIALRTGKVAVSNNVGRDERMGPWAHEALARGYRAIAAVPFGVRGEVPRALVLMASEPDYFQETECRQLEAIGESLSSALTHLRAEASRKARETRLKLLETCVARLNDIVLITEAEPIDKPGPKILYVNDAFERITGYSLAEALGQTPRMLHGPNTQRDALDRIRSSLEKWLPVREEIINYTKDGREFWLEMDIVPVADETGWFTHWIAVERDITERKSAQKQEERLREGFKLLFLGNPHPMWVFDIETRRFLEVNQAAIEQYGYSSNEFKALTIDDIRPDEERQRLKSRVNNVSAGGRDKAGTWIHKRKDGSTVCVDITTQRLIYNGRDAELVVAVDLTERVLLEQQKEKALLEAQESQARLVRAQALAKLGSWERYANDGPAIWSASLFELTGNDPEKGAPNFEDCLSRVHPDDRARYLYTMNQAFKNGASARWTYRCVFPDGSIHWLEENIDEPNRNADGEVTSISGTVQDVTERIEGGEKLQMQLARTELLNQIARASAERLKLDQIFQVACHHLEVDFEVAYAAALLYDGSVNAFRISCLGGGSQQIDAALGLAKDTLLNVETNGLSRCLAGELVYEPQTAELPFEFPRLLAAAGMQSVVLAPMQAQHRVFGVLVAARRRAEGFLSGECEFLRQLASHVALAANHARLYQDLHEAYEELQDAQQTALQQERLRVLGQMASGIAHDINNAISPVTLYTESLLLNEKGLSEKGRKQLQTVQLAIDDVAETVARMREFYRPPEGFSKRISVDLNVLIRQVLDLTRARWRDIPQQSGISIELLTEFDPDLPQVSVVETEMRDAVTNLVLNAIDSMQQGGQLCLSTASVVGGDGQRFVLLEVADTGTGMDAETRKRCMEPFFTTKGQKGSGLGLSMVYGTMQRHEAEITINSEVGQGTTVGLYFKCNTPANVSPKPAREATPATVLPALKILLIDDDAAVLNSLKETLVREGHQVVTAQSGEEGIAQFSAATRAEDRAFEVVITDLGMPKMDGRAVAAAIKAASPHTPVIMLTGWGRRMQEQGECPKGVDRLLAKPPRIGELRDAIAGCLHG